MNSGQTLMHVSLIVKDYDEAIQFYTKILTFDLIEDTQLSDEKRWVLVKPRGPGETCLLLAKASDPRQQQAIGNQSGGRVFLFLRTDNFDGDYGNLLKHHVTIVRPPRDEPYGRVLVFADLYGNKWDLIGPRPAFK